MNENERRFLVWIEYTLRDERLLMYTLDSEEIHSNI